MRIARVQHTLLLALAAGLGRNRGALVSFNAGVAHILGGNREATDSELLGLENLADQVTVESEGIEFGDDEPEVEAEEEASGGDKSVPSLAPLPSEDVAVVQEPVSGAEPETAGDAPAASQASVMPVAGEPAPAGGEQGATTADELFQPQSHGEDDSDGA